LATVAITGILGSIAIPTFINQKNKNVKDVAYANAKSLSIDLLQLLTDSVSNVGATGAPVSISIDSTGNGTVTVTPSAGGSVAVSTSTKLTPGILLNTSSYSYNLATSKTDYCLSVSYQTQTVYWNSLGQQAGCNLVYNPTAATDLTNSSINVAFDPTNITETRATGLLTNGISTAYTISTLRTQTPGWGYYFKLQTRAQASGGKGTLTFWAKGVSGAYTTISPMVCNDPATICPWTGATVNLTSSWQQVTFPYTLSADIVDGTHYLRFGIGNGDNGPLLLQIANIVMTPNA
jgi:hypothetical protein